MKEPLAVSALPAEGLDKRRSRLDPEPSPLRLKRFAVGVTLAELAREADMSLTRASHVERGLTRAHPQEVRALRDALKRLARTTTARPTLPRVRRRAAPRRLLAVRS